MTRSPQVSRFIRSCWRRALESLPGLSRSGVAVSTPEEVDAFTTASLARSAAIRCKNEDEHLLASKPGDVAVPTGQGFRRR